MILIDIRTGRTRLGIWLLKQGITWDRSLQARLRWVLYILDGRRHWCIRMPEQNHFFILMAHILFCFNFYRFVLNPSIPSGIIPGGSQEMPWIEH